jgi:outer membrane biosynthesis protein TonB
MEGTVTMDRTEAMATTVMCSRAPSHTSHVWSAPLDLPATRELLDKRDQPDPKDPTERMERTAKRERLDFKDLWDSKVQLDHPDLQDQRERPEDSSKSTDQPDLKERQERPETQDQREPREAMAPIKAVDPALKETTEVQDPPERQDPRDHPVRKAQPASQEAASTAHHHVPHQGIKWGIDVLPLLLFITIPIGESKFDFNI